MKKMIPLLMALCLALPLPVMAEGADANELLLSATVVPRQEEALKAPATGVLQPFTLRAGDSVAAGDTLFSLEPQKLYADVEGVVATVFVQPGDVADAAVTRYGAVMQIEYKDRYELNCVNATGYNSTENRNLYVGSPVYLRSADEDHFADGIITQASGRSFTVAVIGGDLVYNKDVKVYRLPDYSDKSLLARKTLNETIPPADISISGTVLTVDVKPGDPVKPGDLLMTYVPDTLEPQLRGQADATSLTARDNLIITSLSVTQGASVQKDQVLALAYKAGDYQLLGQLEEKDVGSLALGDTVQVTFEDLGLAPITATVASLSSYGSQDGDTSKYDVYFDFEPPQEVAVGMHATVEK